MSNVSAKTLKSFCDLGSVLMVGMILTACLGKKGDSVSNSDLNFGGNVDPKTQKIQDDIKSFNKTQADLVEANKSGATGCEKLDIMWNQIVKTKQSDNDILPPVANLKEVISFGNGSALRFWRIFKGWSDSEGGSEIRPYENGTNNFIRLTHRYGVLAKLKFVVDKDVVAKMGYTGHYATGNDCVLGRFSSAVPTSVGDRFTPAFSSKFFIDGNSESQVLITQHDIGGQSSGTDYSVDPPKVKSIDNNFYSKYLSNRLSFENGVLSGVGAFSRFFYSAQYVAKEIFKLDYIVDPRELQANHLALKTPTGQMLAENQAKGPRFVWTVAPSEAMRQEFADMAAKDSDFRKHFLSLNSRMNVEGALHSIPVLNVYASDTWTYNPEKDATLIGQFVTNSEFVVSEAADVRLFFKHSIQFHKVPESEGAASPYTQDFPYSQWNDQLFTSDCRLGVREIEVHPTKPDGLDGTFLRDAIINPRSVRKDNSGNLCFPKIIVEKLEQTLAPYLNKL